MAYTSIDNPELYFQTVLWSGNSSSPRTITLDGSEDMQPDWVWIKKRDGADHNQLYDSVRGFGAGKDLCSGQQFEEGSSSNGSTSLGFVSSATSDGFVLTEGNHGTSSIRSLLVNHSGSTFVGWTWKAGTSFTNDASATSIGSIDSTGSANDTAGFSIVSFTGTGSAGTIKHGLTSAPDWIVVKNRSDSGENWVSFNVGLGAGKNQKLNNTEGTQTTSGSWNDTLPTSSVFSVGSFTNVNKSSGSMIAYCFASKKGYSQFGTFKGNNENDGTFVYLGFRPAWVMVKRSDSTADAHDWLIFDNKRNTGNPNDDYLQANETATETTSGRNIVDFYSNGFKCRSGFDDMNASGSTHTFFAFAESPFVNSNGVPNNAR